MVVNWSSGLPTLVSFCLVRTGTPSPTTVQQPASYTESAWCVMTITTTQPAPNSVALGMTTLDITPVIEMETRSACKVGWETTVKKVFCFLEYFSEDSSINTSFFFIDDKAYHLVFGTCSNNYAILYTWLRKIQVCYAFCELNTAFCQISVCWW